MGITMLVIQVIYLKDLKNTKKAGKSLLKYLLP